MCNIYEIPHAETVKPIKMVFNNEDILVIYTNINSHNTSKLDTKAKEEIIKYIESM